MSARDMRDMMGLSATVDRQPPAKKRKTIEKRPEKGMAREVSLLMGERAPPVSMIHMQPKYKQRPRRTQKTTPWVSAPFVNTARSDGLILHHWTRKDQAPKPNNPDGTDPSITAQDTAQVSAMEHEGTEQKEYKFARYNIQIKAPSYTQDMYDAELVDDDWTKQETDYLVDLVKTYAQKWPLVVDRYDYIPQEVGIEPKTRTMEDLKARYYTVSAKCLIHEIPIESMNRQQYSMYECMRDFDGQQEATRKRLAEQHLQKSAAEVQEETALLAELQRIMISQQKLEAERKELRARLDYPHATGTGGAQYMSSQGLAQLFGQLMAADRQRKNRLLKEFPGSGTPTGQSAQTHRDSIAGANSAVSQKRSALARDSIGSAVEEPRAARPLSPRSSARYYVTTHDKISAGVGFASDKLSKLRMAKSQVQSERIASLLQFLKVPDVIPLPTQSVVEAFEQVMAKVHELLDMRKVAEKEEQEVKVGAAEREIRNAKKNGGTATAVSSKAGDGSDKMKRGPVEVIDEDGDVDADGEPETPVESSVTNKTAAATVAATANATGEDSNAATAVTASGGSRGQKRSASVLSGVSGSSSKRTKK